MATSTNTTEFGTVKVATTTGTATAQVSPAGSAGDTIHASGEVDVNETVVTTDEFILDPQSEDAVQVDGQGGESPLLTDGLPITKLADGPPDFTP